MLHFSNRLTYGGVQKKLKEASEGSKDIEDVVGSVKGFLKAQ